MFIASHEGANFNPNLSPNITYMYTGAGFTKYG
jgi:hypothetical protein